MIELPIRESLDDATPTSHDIRVSGESGITADANTETLPFLSRVAHADAPPISKRDRPFADSDKSDANAPETDACHRLPPDQADVSVLDTAIDASWNCNSITLTEPLPGRDYRLLFDLEELVEKHEEEVEEEKEEEEVEPAADLTDEENDVVERLANWLIKVRAAADEITGLTNADAEVDRGNNDHEEPSNPGLFRVVEEFTALRQDVKLQVKSARGLQEQAGSLISGLHRAIEQFQSVAPREQQSARDAVKPLLESLTDLDAALDRGGLAAESARARWLDQKTNHWQELVDAELQALPRWKRWFVSQFSENLANSLRTRFAESWSASQNAQVEGYRLVQNRLRRLLEQHLVIRIETIGRLADPNVMTVVDVTDNDELPSGTVLEELRPGYLWRDQLLRYAEVRVARSREGP